jgi:L-fucose dehydrogenase
VNNAGINNEVGLEHGSPERFAASLKDNLVHYYTITQTTLPFLKQSLGSIVNMASKVAITGQGGTSGYAAAKGQSWNSQANGPSNCLRMAFA